MNVKDVRHADREESDYSQVNAANVNHVWP